MTVSLSHGEVQLELVPERGALVTSLVVAGQPLLYLDRSTLDDPTKNVRGGIPILFPFAGKLVDERFTAAGTTMKQHGFGRNRPWRIEGQDAQRIRLRLVQDSATQAQYPYAYEVAYQVALLARGAQVELHITNHDARPLPLSPGWHPYFRCPAAQKDQVRGDVAGLTADQLGDDREFDFGLVAPADGRSRFEIPSLGTLQLDFSPALRHLQFWSQPGKDFICLEPFYGPNNTVNTERRLEVAPGGSETLFMRMVLA